MARTARYRSMSVLRMDTVEMTRQDHVGDALGLANDDNDAYKFSLTLTMALILVGAKQTQEMCGPCPEGGPIKVERI
jgi:hypothetical protein